MEDGGSCPGSETHFGPSVWGISDKPRLRLCFEFRLLARCFCQHAHHDSGRVASRVSDFGQQNSTSDVQAGRFAGEANADMAGTALGRESAGQSEHQLVALSRSRALVLSLSLVLRSASDLFFSLPTFRDQPPGLHWLVLLFFFLFFFLPFCLSFSPRE